MYSKLLCSKCHNLSSFCTRVPFNKGIINTNPIVLVTSNHYFSQISSSKNLLFNKHDFNSSGIQNFVRTTMKGGPGYTRFGHGRYKITTSRYSYFWYAFVFGGLTFLLFFNPDKFSTGSYEAVEKMNDMKALYSRDTVPRAKELENIKDESSNLQEDSELKEKNNEVSDKKGKVSFRDRKIIEYENRIRQYSTPDKIFRYFATIQILNEKTNEYEIFMTPSDFLRSITYGVIQPEGLGLDSYNKYNPKMFKLDLHLEEDSVFKRLSPKGLISFSDYIFLVTMLSTPTRHFEIAFHMFDIDGNGNIDIGEFEQLQSIIRNQTSFGQRHRDTRMTGSVIKGNSTLNDYFFGPERVELLTVKKFIEFQEKLQAECIQREFEGRELKTRSDGQKVITDIAFCQMILAYAGFGGSKMKEMLKRITNIYNDETNGITLKEYQDFFKVLRSIHDIDVALKFYAIAGASIDKGILKHVSKTVANVDLSDHIIDIIFDLFDENGDGKLSRKEFIQVMKKKLSSGLKRPKDTGFIKLLESATHCIGETFF